MEVAGIHVQDVEEGCIPMGVVALVKAVNPVGQPAWYLRYSEGISGVELVGILAIEAERQKQQFIDEIGDD